MKSEQPEDFRNHLTSKYLSNVVRVICPCCNKENTTKIASKSRGGLPVDTVICNTCSLIFLNPKPSVEDYNKFYSSGDYRRFLNFAKGKKEPKTIKDYFSDEKFNKRKNDGKKIANSYFMDIISPGELFFDSGCDTGGIMAGVQEATDCNLSGNEPSEACARFIKEKIGVKILNCLTETIPENGGEIFRGKVRLISFFGVLEHMNNPVAGLKIANDMLSEGGHIYVESFDIIRRMELAKETVEDVSTLDHQYYFHKAVYEHMLSLTGYDLIRFDYDNQYGKMMRVLAKKKRSVTHRMGYDPEAVVKMVFALDKAGREYRKKLPHLFCKLKNKVYLKARKIGKSLLEK